MNIVSWVNCCSPLLLYRLCLICLVGTLQHHGQPQFPLDTCLAYSVRFAS